MSNLLSRKDARTPRKIRSSLNLVTSVCSAREKYFQSSCGINSSLKDKPMTRNHERLHRDEKDLRSLAMTELQTIYADLGLSRDELDLLAVPRRSFTVSFPVKTTGGSTQRYPGSRPPHHAAGVSAIPI